MTLLKQLMEIAPHSAVANRIGSITDGEKENAHILGILLVTSLRGYDNYLIAKNLQNVTAYLQESELFEQDDDKVLIIQSLNALSNSFMSLDLLQLDDPQKIKELLCSFL